MLFCILALCCVRIHLCQEDIKSHREGKKTLFEKEDDLLSNSTGAPDWARKLPNQVGQHSTYAPLGGVNAQVGGMDLGPLFFCNFEIIWKNSMPAYRDDPMGDRKHVSQPFFPLAIR